MKHAVMAFASEGGKMNDFRRARQPEQRTARRANIVATARSIAKSKGAIHLTISELGRQAQLTKASIYRYFESLEHVLLLILVSELNELSNECSETLAGPTRSIEAVADKITQAYITHPLVCELLGMVSSILEHNISAEAIAEAKVDILDSSDRLARALAVAIPNLLADDAQWLSHSIALYVAGAWPSSRPSDASVEVLSRPEFAGLQTNFEMDLSRFIRVLACGIANEKKSR